VRVRARHSLEVADQCAINLGYIPEHTA